MTFEQIDAHIKKIDFSKYEGKSPSTAEIAANPGDVLKRICGIYRGVRPILSIVLNLPIPTAWKNAVRIFLGAMDSICAEG